MRSAKCGHAQYMNGRSVNIGHSEIVTEETHFFIQEFNWTCIGLLRSEMVNWNAKNQGRWIRWECRFGWTPFQTYGYNNQPKYIQVLNMENIIVK